MQVDTDGAHLPCDQLSLANRVTRLYQALGRLTDVLLQRQYQHRRHTG